MTAEATETALTGLQERAVIALLASPSLEAAAKSAKVSVSSLRRWRLEPAFAAAYRQARFALLEASTAKLRNAASSAVDVLQAAMVDDEAPYSVRIRAAQVILEGAYKSAELEDLSERLDQQEKQIAELLAEVPEARANTPTQDVRGLGERRLP
jgi:hypothetical protein